jgi:hypothetical protein
MSITQGLVETENEDPGFEIVEYSYTNAALLYCNK